MGKYVLYQQAGSANHGCEALVRTILQTIKSIDPSARFTLVSSKPHEDVKYGLNEIEGLQIVGLNKPIKKCNPNWWKLQAGKVFRNSKMQMEAKFNLEWATEDAVFIAMGGDNYCYNKGRAFYDIDRYIVGKKILWGCSVEPRDLDDELIHHLKLFSAISVRETISYNALLEAGLNNVSLIPDTAFNLPTEDNALLKEYVGINISPLIMNYSLDKELIYQNYSRLVQFVLENTNEKIMFLPHVVTDGNDDRAAIKELIRRLEIPAERMLTVEDCNCMQLKGFISKCKFFIGARTHATIAAYSNGIPTLVVGYSVKSKGIAKDIFGDYDDYVVSVEELKSENDLLDKFLLLLNRKDELVIQQSGYTKKAKAIMEETYKKVLGAV